MSDVKTEVSKRLDDYTRAFNTFQSKRTLEFYNVPLIFISNVGVDDFTSPEEIARAADQYFGWLRDRGYKRVEMSDREVSELNTSHAAAMFELVGYDGKGNEVGRFDATYALVKDDQDWKIVVATLLNHSELSELNH